MKLRKLVFGFIAVLLLSIIAPGVLLLENHVAVTEAAKKPKVRISKKNLTVVKGKSKRLKIKGTKKKVKWRSKNKNVAIVNQKGKVTGKKAGKSRIIGKVNGKKYKCIVTVKKPVSNSNKSSDNNDNGNDNSKDDGNDDSSNNSYDNGSNNSSDDDSNNSNKNIELPIIKITSKKTIR